MTLKDPNLNHSKLINMHQGHRHRLRNNLVEKRWENFDEHQILEYVLSLSIPRKDTNELAHSLIANFGSFANVLDASVEDLKQVKGVGEVTATFLHGLPNIFKAYKKSKMIPRPLLTCPEQVFEYFGTTFNHMPNEEFYVLCVDSLSKLIVAKLIAKGTNNEVAFALKTITETAVRTQAQGVILMHNHPNGDPSPSAEDIEMTRQIYYNLNLSHIAVLDHIIIGKCDNSYYSFNRSGLLDVYKKELNNILGKSDGMSNKTPPYSC